MFELRTNDRFHLQPETQDINSIPVQSGVLPIRKRKGELNVLLITTRTRGRWIIPKGGIEPHLSSRASARKEAFEEAGIRGHLSRKPVGQYVHGEPPDTRQVEVFLMKVKRDLSRWPEIEQREKRWFSLDEAIQTVDEPGLVPLLEALKKPQEPDCDD